FLLEGLQGSAPGISNTYNKCVHQSLEPLEKLVFSSALYRGCFMRNWNALWSKKEVFLKGEIMQPWSYCSVDRFFT
ncbi:hypothetical protein ACQP3F_29330, partial [Escherichia coli]